MRRKLRPQRSTAVVLTLQPEAEAKGVTYAQVLAEAKQKVNLADLGIKEVRFRKAVTGGRILELPGVKSAEMADSLAGKLRETLSGEQVRVSRPTKCAEMRISGLDDSVASSDVIAAIAVTVYHRRRRRTWRGVGTMPGRSCQEGIRKW